MKYLAVSKINPKIVEQLEQAHSRVRFEEPKFTHHDQLAEYVGAMEQVDDTMRESKVIQWMTPVLEQTLNLWRARYTQNSDLIRDAQKEKIELENARKQNTRSIGEIETKVAEHNETIATKRDEIHEHQRTGLESESVDLGAERLKVILLLAFSFIVAMGTYVYFANAQLATHWATMTPAVKVSEVKTLILGGSLVHYSAFSEYLEDVENKGLDELTIDDLGGIDKTIIAGAPKPTLSQFFTNDPTAIFLAAGAFMLILLGKVTAIVYEKLGSPNWMYYLIFIMAIVVLVGAIYTMASIESRYLKLTTLNAELDNKLFDLKELRDQGVSLFGGISRKQSEEESPEIEAINAEIEVMNDKRKEIEESFQDYRFASMILFMITELLLGSLAWIGYSEYVGKRMRLKKGTEGYVKLAEHEINRIRDEISTLNQDKQERESANHMATDLIHRLNAMLSDIISREQLDQLAQNYMERELAFAQQILQKARSQW